MENTIFRKGDHICLEGLSEKHLSEKYVSWLNDPEVNLHNQHATYPQTIETVRGYIKSVEGSRSDVALAILDRKKNSHIGNVSLNTIDMQNRSAEISILIGDKNFWGKGLASETYQLMIQYGFKTLGLHRLWLGTSELNLGMLAVAKKLGFSEEGRLKHAFYKEGQYLDIVQFSLINPDDSSGSKK